MKNQHIEILNTLNEIKKVNDMLVYHQTRAIPSQSALENYLTLRADLTDQLNELLVSYQLTIQIKETSAIAA
jgi:hypothetical protein